MIKCLECKKRDEEIESLKVLVTFYTVESIRWRDLFNEQRGGVIYDKLQKKYAKEVFENIKLLNELTNKEG